VQVDFYQLGGAPLDRTLARIAERVLEGGGRLLVVSGDPAQLSALDDGLWRTTPESFLPHGREGADQPVLLADVVDAVNGARNIALVDGRWRDAALGFDRAFHFFDEHNVVEARAAWRSLAGKDGVIRNFWRRDEGGRWIRAA